MIHRLARRLSGACAGLAISCLPKSGAQRLADECLRTRHRLLEQVRRIEARHAGDESIAHLRNANGVPLKRHVLGRDAPWDAHAVAECPTPGMLTQAEKRYYDYITQYYRGEGAVVEIGTWLGLSTFYLVTGLRKNASFTGPMHCFDDYVWRAHSQTKWVEGTNIVAPEHCASFQPLFEEQTTLTGVRDAIEVHRMKLSTFEGNRDLPQFAWDGGPIELLVVDCGRTLEVNEAWYSACEPSFVPDKTLVVMQDWQCYKSVPETFWENTKLFTDRKLLALELVHEINGGSIATFLYRGRT